MASLGGENADPALPPPGRIQAGRCVSAARRDPRRFDNGRSWSFLISSLRSGPLDKEQSVDRAALMLHICSSTLRPQARMVRKIRMSPELQSFILWIAHNPLKNPKSDEGIQGNPKESKPDFLGFPWILLDFLGVIWQDPFRLRQLFLNTGNHRAVHPAARASHPDHLLTGPDRSPTVLMRCC
jgi:hypothetical protein